MYSINGQQASAQLLFNAWNESDDAVILHTATTDLYNCEIVEISVIDLSGNVLFDSLVKPRGEISLEATQYHEITKEMVEDPPNWLEVWENLYPILEGKKVLAYNAEFCSRVMIESFQSCFSDWWDEKFKNLREQFDGIDNNFCCVMEAYADLTAWDQWPKLEFVAGRELTHRALDSCQATLEVVKKSYKPNFSEMDYQRVLIHDEYKRNQKEIDWISNELKLMAVTQCELHEKQKKYLEILLNEEKLREHIKTSREIAITKLQDDPFEDDGKPIDIDDDQLPF